VTEADSERAPGRALASEDRAEGRFAPDAGFDDLGWARPDTDREARLGLPEVVYGVGKSAGQIAGVVGSLLAANSGPVLVTRVDSGTAAAVIERVADAGRYGAGDYDSGARLLRWRPAARLGFRVAVVSAGTSDGPVAAEAMAVARSVGLTVESIADVGVAGIHRLLAQRDRLNAADAVICVAGMDGALPSVVGGLVGAPVIAVPTSVGYGASFEGLAPLLAMLSSCSAGVVVVNIDSGFGAAMAAYRIARAVVSR
jgi:hypothetical protein